MVKRLFRNPQAILGLALILIVLLAAVLSPLLAPHDPNDTDLTKRYLTPCPEYPLGRTSWGAVSCPGCCTVPGPPWASVSRYC